MSYTFKSRLKLLFFCGLLLPVLSVRAQNAVDEENSAADAEETPEYYQVELIFFRHLDQSRTTPEIPRMPEAELSEVLEQELARLSGTSPDEASRQPGDTLSLSGETELTEGIDQNLPDDESGLPFLLEVPDEQLMLSGTARQINNLQAYELLDYLHWAQPAPDVTEARQLELTEVGADPGMLSGNIEVHQRRYLHMLIDVSLGNSDSSAPSGSAYEVRLPGGDGAKPALKDSRRIRLEQINYFDQPQFGVLAIISRFEFPGGDEGGS